MDWAVVGGSLGGAVAAALVLTRIIDVVWPRKNGVPPAADPVLLSVLREQTTLLREMRDGMVAFGYQQREAGAALARVEQSMSALHRRFDSVTGPRT